MKKILVLALGVMTASLVASAQNLKFGHINLDEVVYLMDEMDSARVKMERFNQEIQETYAAMIEEFSTKQRTYQEMGASWTNAVRQSKEQELMALQTRIQQYEQSASADLSAYQQQIMEPVMQVAIKALEEVGKANGLIYIFNTSAGAVPYVNTAISIDVTEQVKAKLGISPDKTLPQAGAR